MDAGTDATDAPRGPRWRRGWAGLAVLAAIFLPILFFRRGQQLLSPQVWDEDGTFIFTGLLALGVPPLYRAGFPVAVCWSAKAGCTTVLKWFLHHTGRLETALARNPWPHQYRACVQMYPLTDYVAACERALRGGDLAAVEDRYGLPRSDLRRFSDSTHHNLPDHRHRWPGDVARFAATADDLERLGTPPAEAFLDARVSELVQLAYACDYEASGSLYAVQTRRAMLRRAA